MNIKEQNILGVNSHETDLQIPHCGHQIRELKEIKKFLSEDCILCFEALTGDKQLCIYNCGHMMHVNCLIDSQTVDGSKDTCLSCINKITSMAVYKNSKQLEEHERYTCTDDHCNERRKQERMVPFSLIKDYIATQNQIVQNQIVQNQAVQSQAVQSQAVQSQAVQNQDLLLEIYQNIALTLNENQAIRLLQIVTSSSITANEKQQQIIDYVTEIGISVDFSSILIGDNSLPVTNSVVPDVNVNTSRSSSNTITDNVDTIATTSESTSRSSIIQQPINSCIEDQNSNSLTATSASTSGSYTIQQSATRCIQNQNCNILVAERRLSSDDTSETSDTPMIGTRRKSFLSRVKNVFLCKK